MTKVFDVEESRDVSEKRSILGMDIGIAKT